MLDEIVQIISRRCEDADVVVNVAFEEDRLDVLIILQHALLNMADEETRVTWPHLRAHSHSLPLGIVLVIKTKR